MKHCPECNKNYADPTLGYCLDDGTRLIYGPAVEEAETVILGVAATEHKTERLEKTGKIGTPRFNSQRKTVFAGILGIAIILVAGIGTYVHYGRSSSEQIQSIAVMPFVNRTGSQDFEYLSDGMTESLISSLAQVPGLKVMSRTSVFHYKGKEVDPKSIASELNVQAVLTGTLTQQGENLSISVELINPQDNSQLWGQQYNRKLTDVFAVQQEMAKEITERLRLKLTGAEQRRLAKRPTENLQAYRYYMQARSLTQRRTREDLLMAVSYCEKAISEDTNYALAYAGLADAYENLGVRGYVTPIEALRKAEEAARTALTLDENLGEAHAQVGYSATAFAPYNFPLGDRELRSAIELSPSLANAHQYLALSLEKQGRLDEALTEIIKARELDPLSSVIARQEALPYYLKRDHARAMKLLRQADELGPALNTTFEIGIYIQNRLFDEALAKLEQARRERKDDSILVFDEGMLHAARGEQTDALQAIRELEGRSGPSLDQAHYIAKIYATLNEKEMALSWLDRGLAAGSIGSFYKDEPVWDTVRSDARFVYLVRRMGIPNQ